MSFKCSHAIAMAVSLAFLAPRAFAQGEAVKPYFMVIVDNSGSMDTSTGGGANSCGQPQTRMSDAKCVLQRILHGYGDVLFGLERFVTDCSGTCSPSCDTTCGCNCSYLDCNGCNSDGSGCPAGGETADQAEVLVDIREDNLPDILRWIDYTCDTCATTGGDPELSAETWTPIAGALRAARRYYEGGDPDFPTSPILNDPFAGCRPYRVILLTDGRETCASDAETVAAATELRSTTVGPGTYDVLTCVVGFGITPGSATIENIAVAGGTDAPGPFSAYYADDESQLSNAFSQIIADAVLVEVCNGADDDCDGDIDEGFQLYCDIPGGTPAPTLCVDPGDPCDGVDDNCYRGIEDEDRNVCGLCGPDCICEQESCNGLDDDCDGETDEGFDLGAPCDRPDDEDLCETGVKTCAGCDETEEFPEVCDGADNNCNTLVDEFLTRPCDLGCGEGSERCSDGAWVGCTAPASVPEDGLVSRCDCKDNDCDGQTDENTCPFPSVCLPPPYCRCAEPCGNEIPCPPGTTPSKPDLDAPDCYCRPDTCAGVACPPTEDGAQVCVDGVCQPICEVNDCRAPLTCDPETGACVSDDCGGCADGQFCVGGTCVDDPCAGVQCPEDQFCRGGECFRSCADVVCPQRQSCMDGVCVDDPCGGVLCPQWQVCDPETGECRHDPCVEVGCGENQRCDSVTGQCVVDPCLEVRCPEGQACRDGNCWTPEQAAGERPRPRQWALISGEGGCGCSVGRTPPPSGAALALLLLLPFLGRARRLARHLAAFALALALAGCEANPYCVDCDPVVSDPDGGTRDCVPEICNGLDDDCDGFTDEGLIRPCGLAVGACQEGNQSCVAGLWGPCAGEIQPGLEVCDSADNDCDGATDEGFDLDVDPLNCGSCGNACSAEHGTASCESGICTFLCEPNWWDADEISGNGCEYFCVFVAEDEICNGLDENCDGVTDEPPLPGEGGLCGDSAGECQVGTLRCVDGALTCAEGFVGPESEICDGLDNDCDSATDNGFPGLGQACTRGTGTCTTNGTFVCNAEQSGIECDAADPPSPGTEVCNGLDDDCDEQTDEGVPNRMVHVVDAGAGLDFWIDAYEASRPDATDQAPGAMDHRTCSEPNRVPWTNVTYGEAQAACAATGARLCTEEEWQRACEAAGAGTCQWSYGSACDTFNASTCNGDAYDVDPVTPGDQDGLVASGSLAQCYADWGAAGDRVFDLSGNAKEWTEARSAGINPIRGGTHNNDSVGISCQFDFVTGDDAFLFENVGFRCCRDTAP